MGRLCERPGCSENASVAYGMRAEDLVFWLDVIRPSEEIVGGVLCRRHADSMVVPRNWTLDDLRDPELHLFRPPEITRVPSTRTRRSIQRSDAEQLQLGGVETTADEVHADEPVLSNSVDAVIGEIDAESTEADGSPWVPTFDSGDDLDGLLSARSPLLSRAFRGDDRRR